MHTRSAFRRISTPTFVAALLLIGMPRPTSAAGEENAAVARHRGLTINGRPLTQLVSATADAGPFWGWYPLLGQGQKGVVARVRF